MVRTTLNQTITTFPTFYDVGTMKNYHTWDVKLLEKQNVWVYKNRTCGYI